ncbi:MAG: proton-conducting transporter membrane subunit [Thermoanaerobaculaceae bacterium]
MDRPLVTLCFLRRPVDFGAVDGKPVVALFSLVSSTPKMHLHLLSRLAYALRDPGVQGGDRPARRGERDPRRGPAACWVWGRERLRRPGVTLLLLAVGVLAVTGLGALFCRDGARAGAVAAWGAVVSGVLATVPAGRALLGASIPRLELPWSVPLGSFVLAVDALSAVFLLVIALLGALAAVYGVPYLAHAAPGRRLGVSWCLYNLLLASLVLVVTARDGVLFLMAWEGMSLASYFLVTFEDHKAEVREAGWTYLLATHLGTAFLLAMFLLIAQGGPLDLEQGRHAAPAGGERGFFCSR